MNRYLAKLVFNINIGNGRNISQFDQQMRMIEAQNIQEAFSKASLIGKKEEEDFLNNDNKMVKWEFINVSELYLLENLKDGDQLYSKTYECEDAVSYINTVHQKSSFIQTSFLTFA